MIFRISKNLLNKNIYLVNFLEYQKIGILLELNKKNCELDKFFLYQEHNKIKNIQDRIKNGNISDIEINDFINNLNKLFNKI